MKLAKVEVKKEKEDQTKKKDCCEKGLQKLTILNKIISKLICKCELFARPPDFDISFEKNQTQQHKKAVFKILSKSFELINEQISTPFLNVLEVDLSVDEDLITKMLKDCPFFSKLERQFSRKVFQHHPETASLIVFACLSVPKEVFNDILFICVAIVEECILIERTPERQFKNNASTIQKYFERKLSAFDFLALMQLKVKGNKNKFEETVRGLITALVEPIFSAVEGFYEPHPKLKSKNNNRRF